MGSHWLAKLFSGPTYLSSTVVGNSSCFYHLSEQFTSWHKQVDFEPETRTVQFELNANSICDHLRDSVRNCSSRKTKLYFESECLQYGLESM